MKLIKHNSAEQIIAAYWHFDENDMTIEDFLLSDGEAETEDGEAVSFSGADELAAMKENGFWGYCDPKTKTVNVWIGEKADAEAIIYFLAHEVGHATGKQIKGDSVKVQAAEERRADEYGRVAQQAFIWLKELIPSDLPRGA